MNFPGATSKSGASISNSQLPIFPCTIDSTNSTSSSLSGPSGMMISPVKPQYKKVTTIPVVMDCNKVIKGNELDDLIGVRDTDKKCMNELSERAVVEREMYLRSIMTKKCSPRYRKSWPEDGFALLQNETPVSCGDNSRVVPMRPSNPQCRDPLFMKHEHQPEVGEKHVLFAKDLASALKKEVATDCKIVESSQSKNRECRQQM